MGRHSFSLYKLMHYSSVRKKLWYIDTMEYYSAIRKGAILPFETTWMGPENTMLS